MKADEDHRPIPEGVCDYEGKVDLPARLLHFLRQLHKISEKVLNESEETWFG